MSDRGVRSVLLLCWRDTGHPQGGGSERYLEQVGAQLAARGVSVTLRTARYPGAPRRETVDGVRISRAAADSPSIRVALAAIALGRLGLGPLRGVRPDAVIDTQNGIPFFARPRGRPAVVLVHHGHREQWPVAGRLVGQLGWWLESRLSPRAHRRNQYLTVSLPSAEELAALGVDRDRIAVVRNGAEPVPADAAAGRPAGAPAASSCCPGWCRTSRSRTRSRPSPRCVPDPGLHLDVIGGGWWADNLTARAANSASPTRSPSTGTSTTYASTNCSRAPGCTCCRRARRAGDSRSSRPRSTACRPRLPVSGADRLHRRRRHRPARRRFGSTDRRRRRAARRPKAARATRREGKGALARVLLGAECGRDAGGAGVGARRQPHVSGVV